MRTRHVHACLLYPLSCLIFVRQATQSTDRPDNTYYVQCSGGGGRSRYASSVVAAAAGSLFLAACSPSRRRSDGRGRTVQRRQPRQQQQTYRHVMAFCSFSPQVPSYVRPRPSVRSFVRSNVPFGLFCTSVCCWLRGWISMLESVERVTYLIGLLK